jgi:hypothetical protein
VSGSRGSIRDEHAAEAHGLGELTSDVYALPEPGLSRQGGVFAANLDESGGRCCASKKQAAFS